MEEERLTIEQSFFIDILSDHINRRKTSVPSGKLDWNIIVYYAQIQQVEGIIFFQCKNFLPDEIKYNLEEKYGSTLSIYANQEHNLKCVKSMISSYNIEYFIVKGFLVASYYPLPPLRTMGDTDLIVHSEERKRVHELLLKIGYINASRNEYSEWVYYKGKYELELHDRLIYSGSINRRKHEEFFIDPWNHVHNGVLDWNYHLVFLILHLRKHLMNYGVGFRQFMDIAVVTKNNSELDWKWIEEQLAELDLIEFTQKVFALNESWFDVETPLQNIELNSTFFVLATEQIFNNGIFGFDNHENKDNLEVNNALNGKNIKVSMFASAIREVFPSYNKMVSVSKYGFIEGKKWLLPVAWIYRIITGANKSHFSQEMRKVKSPFVSNKTIEKREEYLKQWGLYDFK